MQREGESDRFEIVNGPEDGTEFPITRTPQDIGADTHCSVFVRLDPDVRRVHARITVVAEGYRVRKVGNGAVWVDGRRVGLVRSRIVRQGGIVKVGNTELCCCTAPDGLASRSYGLPQESDLGWALRLLSGALLRLVPGLFIFLRDTFGGSFKFLLPLLLIVVGVEYFYPGLLAEGRDLLYLGWLWIRGLVTQFTGY